MSPGRFASRAAAFPERRWLTTHSLGRFYQFAVSLVLAIVWLRSSSAHFANPYYFLSSVYRYELVGPLSGQIIAMALPLLQLLLTVCFIGRLFVGGAFLMSGAVLSTFVFAQASAAARGLNIDCGCFGASLNTKIGNESLLTVGSLLFLALTGYFAFVLSRNRPLKTVLAARADAAIRN